MKQGCSCQLDYDCLCLFIIVLMATKIGVLVAFFDRAAY